MSLHISVDKKKISAFCKQHHIKKLSFFGSVLRNDFRPESDIDVLVEFDPDHIPGLAFFSIQEELSKILNREVDLHTPHFLSPYFRDLILSEAEVQYAA